MVGLLSVLPMFLAPIKADPVVYSFAFFGCNRVDKDDWNPESNPSSANLPQLRQSFEDISKIKPLPDLLFMTGDLVLGYGNDQGEEVRKQLDGWIAEYRHSPLNGKLKMIPLPGNHEMNRKVEDKKVASPYTTTVWNDWIKTNDLPPHSPNGPQEGGPDQLSDDQSISNFSFSTGKLHFICLNTDARVSDERIGFVPAHWIANDLKVADSKRMTTFILGHRNVVDGISCKGDAPIEPKSGREMIQAMQSSPGTVAYLCAHVHAWDVSKVDGKKPWQIIAGNGGSKLEKDWKPEGGTTYGFAVIEVHKSGKIMLTPYFRKAHKKYDSEDVKPAKPAAPIMLGVVRK